MQFFRLFFLLLVKCRDSPFDERGQGSDGQSLLKTLSWMGWVWCGVRSKASEKYDVPCILSSVSELSSRLA